jgi:2-methylcitrate dehydratase PrpD
MAKIKVIPDEAIEALLPEKTLIRVVATTLDGARHSVEVVNPLGHPDNPMQDRHIEEKFIALADLFSGRSAAEPPSTAGGKCKTSERLAKSFKCST